MNKLLGTKIDMTNRKHRLILAGILAIAVIVVVPIASGLGSFINGPTTATVTTITTTTTVSGQVVTITSVHTLLSLTSTATQTITLGNSTQTVNSTTTISGTCPYPPYC